MDRRKLKRQVRRYYVSKGRYINNSNYDPRKKIQFRFEPLSSSARKNYYSDCYIYCGKIIIAAYEIPDNNFRLCDPIG